MGCKIDNVSIDEAILRIDDLIQHGSAHRYFAVNVHKIVEFRRSPGLLRIANESDLVTADGQPIVWLSQWIRTPLKERVAGVDLMDRLLAVACERQYRLYFLGAKQDILEAALAQYRQRLPGLNIVGYRNGYWSQKEEAAIVKAIQATRPHILFLGMSSPAKELFMDRYSSELNVPFMMGVGGAFDVGAGLFRRAPAWMQARGLEWLWRLAQEPGRLWRRYVSDGIYFIAIASKELLSSSKGGRN